MQGIGRTFILIAAFGLMLWYALAQGPEDPAPDASTSRPGNTDDDAQPERQQGWSREERAIWRDTVNQRLGS